MRHYEEKTHEKVTHLYFLCSLHCYQLTTHVNRNSEQLVRWGWLEYASAIIPAISSALQILGLVTFILWPSRYPRKIFMIAVCGMFDECVALNDGLMGIYAVCHVFVTMFLRNV